MWDHIIMYFKEEERHNPHSGSTTCYVAHPQIKTLPGLRQNSVWQNVTLRNLQSLLFIVTLEECLPSIRPQYICNII